MKKGGVLVTVEEENEIRGCFSYSRGRKEVRRCFSYSRDRE